MKFLIQLLLTLYLVFYNTLNANIITHEKDSISLALNKCTEDTNKVNLLLQLARMDFSPVVCIEYAVQALAIEKKFNYKKIIIIIILTLMKNA